MLKKIIAKLSVSIILALLLLLPLKSTEALAATTKNVTQTVYQSFIGTTEEIDSQFQAYITSHYTYAYDDGSYSGSLNINNVILESQTLQYGNIYLYVFRITYSGVVTRYPASIYVTETVYHSFIGTTDEIGSQFQDYINANNTYYYDYNYYRGNIGISGVSLESQTLQYGNIYLYVFKFTYSGYVSSY
jgi:hypothetical protein